MQSIIITTNSAQKREDYALSICSRLKINPFDITILEPKEDKDKIGIEDVRSLQKKMFLKPFKSPIKAALIKNAESLTPEAQNSLLKLIEEPPANTLIILTALSKDMLLPTILSRCKIIELKDATYEVSESEMSQNIKTLNFLSSATVGERLKLAQDLAKNLPARPAGGPAGRQGKEEAIVFLEKMIFAVRNELFDYFLKEKGSRPLISQFLNYLISLQNCHTVLKTTNASPRLSLENLFLGL